MSLVYRSAMMALPMVAVPPGDVVHVSLDATSRFIDGLPQADRRARDAGPDWVIADCRVVANYCTGLRMGNGTRVSRCTIRDNGHVGILVGREINVDRARDTIVEDTTLDNNCRFNMNRPGKAAASSTSGGDPRRPRSGPAPGAQQRRPALPPGKI